MSIKYRFSGLLILLLALAGCQEDLIPSSDELEPSVSSRMGEVVDDFTFTLSDGSSAQLSDRLASHDAVVLYFTMWCPVCDSHMSHFRTNIKPQFSNVDFIFVDYVSGSVTYARDAQQALGYTDFSVIADFDNRLEHYFSGTMATTIIIDKNFLVRYHESFKTSESLINVLNNL